MGPKFFLLGISWVQKFFSWVFRGSEIFSRGYFVDPKFFSWVFVGPKFFLVSIFVGPKFSCGYFVCSKFFSREYFAGPIFFSCGWFRDSKILSCWLHKQKWQKQKYENTSQTTYSFLEKCIRKVFHLLNYLRHYTAFICSNYIFRQIFFSVLGSFHS